MLKCDLVSSSRVMLLAGVLAGIIFVSPTKAQSPPQPTNHYRSSHLPQRAEMYYGGLWGVDSFQVRLAESGELIRFSYHVLSPEKAAPLNDKRTQPFLIDPQAGVQLVVPTMDKIGQLRQTNTPEAGKSYWIAFSNKGRLVKRGDRVTVAIGTFRVDGLEVQ